MLVSPLGLVLRIHEWLSDCDVLCSYTDAEGDHNEVAVLVSQSSTEFGGVRDHYRHVFLVCPD